MYDCSGFGAAGLDAILSPLIPTPRDVILFSNFGSKGLIGPSVDCCCREAGFPGDKIPGTAAACLAFSLSSVALSRASSSSSSEVFVDISFFLIDKNKILVLNC